MSKKSKKSKKTISDNGASITIRPDDAATGAFLIAQSARIVQEFADDIRELRGPLEADPDAPLYADFTRLQRRLQEDAAALLAAAEDYDEYAASA